MSSAYTRRRRDPRTSPCSSWDVARSCPPYILKDFLPAAARGLRPRVDQLRHALARRLVRKAADAAADVVEHVIRLARPRAGHGDGRVADDVLEEELRPRPGIEIGGPIRKGRVARALEEDARAARAEGEVRHHADLPLP